MNRVVLVGRLARDVELRYTQSGTAIGSFSMAVDRRRTNQNGERETDFINCKIWAKGAENLANFVLKGSRVAIEGRIETGSYQNQQGQKVYTTEVVVDNFDLIETRAESESRRGDNQNGYTAPINNQGNVNFGNAQPSPFTQQVTQSQDSPFVSDQAVDDNLPF